MVAGHGKENAAQPCWKKRGAFAFALTVLLSVAALLARSWILAAWATVEIVFWLWLEKRWKCMSASHHLPSPENIHARLTRFYSLVGVLDMKGFLSGWHKNASFEQLRRENVKDFFSYGLWHKDRAHMSPQEEEDLNEFVDQIQLRFGISIPRGYNKDVQHMAHLLEDLQVAFKPLVMYLFFELLNLWSSILLTFIGFRKYSTPSFSYWGRNLEQPVKPLPEPNNTITQHVAYPLLKVDEQPTPVATSKRRPPRRTSNEFRRRPVTRACASAGAATSIAATTAVAADIHSRPNILDGDIAAKLDADIEASDASEYSDSSSSGTPADDSRDSGMFSAFYPSASASLGQQAPQTGFVFLHGVGVGILPYLAFIWKALNVFPQDMPMIVPQMNHVSQRLFSQSQPTDQVVSELAGVLKLHRLEAAHFCGHSFGTFILARMRQLYPHLVKSALLCEPVCMVACAPQLVAQFVYHNHTQANIFKLLCHPAAFAKWIVSRDLVLAHHFGRNFWWENQMMWPSQLPTVCVVCLSTDDEYVPVDFVEKLVAQKVLLPGEEKHLKRVMYVTQSSGAHGAFLMSPEVQDRALATFKQSIELCA